MACSVVKTRESRPKTIEAGSLGGPGVNPFHSKEEAEISAVFAGGVRDKRTLGEAQTEGKWVPAAKRCDLVGVKPGLGGENRRLVV